MEKSESCKEGIDRISSLPEDIHSKILSLLPTKNAAATSILSKRWRFLWTCITNLTFDDGTNFECFKSSEKSLMVIRQKFTQIVNNVLAQLNTHCIHNFYLKCQHGSCRDSFHLQFWICEAIRRTIQKLELRLELAETMDLQLSKFNCKTLSVLKLSCNDGKLHLNNVESSASICFRNLQTLHLSNITFTIASNCSVSFPCLKDLYLGKVKYANEESVHKLFASCPVLDSLSLRRMYPDNDNDNVRGFIISIPSLRSLKTYSYCEEVILRAEHHTCREYKLQIDTPALEYLSLQDRSFCEYNIKNLSCLVNAEVMFDSNHLPRGPRLRVDRLFKTKDIYGFIKGLFNVRFLSISGDVLKLIGSKSENFAPIFHNLTRLELAINTCCDSFIIIKNLLEKSDNLEHLIIKEISCSHPHASWRMEPLSVPLCLLQQVTTISFRASGCCNSQIELVRYFLKNAKVLELMTIPTCISRSVFKSRLMQEISMFPRGSRACQIEFR